jgi:hypothetical protein
MCARVVAFLFTFVVTLTLLNAAEEPKDPKLGDKIKEAVNTGKSLDGVYSIHGEDAKDAYTGVAILRKVGDGYFLVYTTFIENENGFSSSTYRGTGIRTGDTFAVSWGEGKDNGVTLYSVQADGELHGRWVLKAGGKAQTERLHKIGGLPKLD